MDIGFYDHAMNPPVFPLDLPPNGVYAGRVGPGESFSEERHYSYVSFGQDYFGHDIASQGTIVVNERDR